MINLRSNYVIDYKLPSVWNFRLDEASVFPCGPDFVATQPLTAKPLLAGNAEKEYWSQIQGNQGRFRDKGHRGRSVYDLWSIFSWLNCVFMLLWKLKFLESSGEQNLTEVEGMVGLVTEIHTMVVQTKFRKGQHKILILKFSGKIWTIFEFWWFKTLDV